MSLKRKDLRDEIAMSMNFESIPKMENTDSINEMAELIGIEVDLEDTESIVNFGMKYEAYMRYKFADAMIEARGKEA